MAELKTLIVILISFWLIDIEGGFFSRIIMPIICFLAQYLLVLQIVDRFFYRPKLSNDFRANPEQAERDSWEYDADDPDEQ